MEKEDVIDILFRNYNASRINTLTTKIYADLGFKKV